MEALHFSSDGTLKTIILGISTISFISLAFCFYYNKFIIALLTGFVAFTCLITGIHMSMDIEKENVKSLQTWAKQNYNLTLTYGEAESLYSDETITVKKKDSPPTRIKLTESKNGYLLSGENEIIKQEHS